MTLGMRIDREPGTSSSTVEGSTSTTISLEPTPSPPVAAPTDGSSVNSSADVPMVSSNSPGINDGAPSSSSLLRCPHARAAHVSSSLQDQHKALQCCVPQLTEGLSLLVNAAGMPDAAAQLQQHGQELSALLQTMLRHILPAIWQHLALKNEGSTCGSTTGSAKVSAQASKILHYHASSIDLRPQLEQLARTALLAVAHLVLAPHPSGTSMGDMTAPGAPTPASSSSVSPANPGDDLLGMQQVSAGPLLLAAVQGSIDLFQAMLGLLRSLAKSATTSCSCLRTPYNAAGMMSLAVEAATLLAAVMPHRTAALSEACATMTHVVQHGCSLLVMMIKEAAPLLDAMALSKHDRDKSSQAGTGSGCSSRASEMAADAKHWQQQALALKFMANFSLLLPRLHQLVVAICHTIEQRTTSSNTRSSIGSNSSDGQSSAGSNSSNGQSSAGGRGSGNASSCPESPDQLPPSLWYQQTREKRLQLAAPKLLQVARGQLLHHAHAAQHHLAGAVSEAADACARAAAACPQARVHSGGSTDGQGHIVRSTTGHSGPSGQLEWQLCGTEPLDAVFKCLDQLLQSAAFEQLTGTPSGLLAACNGMVAQLPTQWQCSRAGCVSLACSTELHLVSRGLGQTERGDTKPTTCRKCDEMARWVIIVSATSSSLLQVHVTTQ